MAAGAEGEGANRCPGAKRAVVFDIDETLTTSDTQNFIQLIFSAYDQKARPGAVELVNFYADQGYKIFYLTARPANIRYLGLRQSPERVTNDWLWRHGFPIGEGISKTTLAPTFVNGDSAAAYKAGALKFYEAQGWQFDYAYGNAESDIAGYAGAGIPKDRTYIIGEYAGADGTVPVWTEGYESHIEHVLPNVPAAC
jgi:phosphatidate phosphatase PAH1